MNAKFLIAFALCLASYVFHTVTHALEHKGHRFGESSPVHTVLSITMFIGYFAWGLLIAWDPIKMKMSSYVASPLGLLIGLIGLVMVIVSTITKKGFGEIDHLVTTGVYLRIRHPMYFGLMLVHIGFPLAARSLLTLISAVIWIPLILLWRYWEEQDLEKRFGKEYSEYKKRTLF